MSYLRGVLPPGRVDARVALRWALEADRERLFAWHVQGYQDHITRIWGWDADWQRRDFARLFARVRPLVVTVDDRDAGYLQVMRRAGGLHLVNIVLAPEARGIGVGGALLAHLQARARALGCPVTLRVFRTNARAEAFYARHGFRRTGEGQTHAEMGWSPDAG